MNIEKVQAVLFDFDGTLFFGTPELNAWCFERALDRLSLPPFTQEMIDRTIGMTFRDIARLMTRSEEEAMLQRFETETFRAAPEYIARYVKPDPGAHRMLETLHEKAYLAICSNATEKYLYPMVEALELRSRLDDVWAHHPGVTKAQAIPKLMEHFGVQRAVFVGDRAEDVHAAREAGIPVVGIRNKAYPWETDEADIAVKNHEEMTKAILTLLA